MEDDPASAADPSTPSPAPRWFLASLFTIGMIVGQLAAVMIGVGILGSVALGLAIARTDASATRLATTTAFFALFIKLPALCMVVSEVSFLALRSLPKVPERPAEIPFARRPFNTHAAFLCLIGVLGIRLPEHMAHVSMAYAVLTALVAWTLSALWWVAGDDIRSVVRRLLQRPSRG